MNFLKRKQKKKYIHNEIAHNIDAPEKIVPEILQLVTPASVVDIGCGIGTFLHVFKKHGVTDVLGIDGPWVDRQLLTKYINPDEFQELDLTKKIELDKKYDLAVSLEVAEHLPEDSAEIHVKNLVNFSDVILFSAAIPYQGGQNHVNEQWLTYWEKLFLQHNYVIHDIIRPIIWDNPDIFWWYKQNMVFITNKEYAFSADVRHSLLRKVVHYDVYNELNEKLERINKGKEKKRYYLKLLLRSIFW